MASNATITKPTVAKVEQTHPQSRQVDTGQIIAYIVLTIGAIISLIPFFYTISVSLMNLTEATGGAFLPSTPNGATTAKPGKMLISLTISGIPSRLPPLPYLGRYFSVPWPPTPSLNWSSPAKISSLPYSCPPCFCLKPSLGCLTLLPSPGWGVLARFPG